MFKIILEDIRSTLIIVVMIIIMVTAFAAFKEAAPNEESKELIEDTGNSFINAFFIILAFGGIGTIIALGFWIYNRFNL